VSKSAIKNPRLPLNIAPCPILFRSRYGRGERGIVPPWYHETVMAGRQSFAGCSNVADISTGVRLCEMMRFPGDHNPRRTFAWATYDKVLVGGKVRAGDR
jgi:hypothetical protein